MVSSATAWLISDSIKLGLASIFLAISLLQLMKHSSVVSRRRIQWTSLLSILVYITWQLGAHDPVQFGWQVDVISVTIFVIIEMALYTYIVTLLINSHLAAVQNRLGVLESLRTTYITFGMTLALTLPAVSLILILETGQVRWSIFSTCSYGIACATTGFYISVVMIILGRYLDKMRRRAEKRGSYLRTALSPKAMRKLSCSVFSSNNNSKIPTSSNHTIYKSHRNEPAPPSPSPCGAHAAGAKGGGGLRTIMSGFWIGTLTGSSSSMVGPAAATATTTTTGNTMTTTGSSIKAAASGKNNGFDSSATLKANCFTSDQKTMTLHDSAPSLKEEKEISKSYKGEASKSVTVTVSSTAWDHHPLATQPSPTSNSNQGIRIKAAAAAIGTRKVYDMSRNTLPACRAGSSDSCVKNNNSSRGASAVRATTTSKKKSSSLTHIGDITSSATTTNEPDSKIDKAMAPTAMSMPSMVTGEHGRGGGGNGGGMGKAMATTTTTTAAAAATTTTNATTQNESSMNRASSPFFLHAAFNTSDCDSPRVTITNIEEGMHPPNGADSPKRDTAATNRRRRHRRAAAGMELAKKFRRLSLCAAILSVAFTLVAVLHFLGRVNDSRSYREVYESSNRNYSIFDDLTSYASAGLIAFGLYYSSGSSSGRAWPCC